MCAFGNSQSLLAQENLASDALLWAKGSHKPSPLLGCIFISSLPANPGVLRFIPGLGRSLGEWKGYPLEYSGLETSMDCIAHRVTKSQTRPNGFQKTKKASLGATQFQHLPVPTICILRRQNSNQNSQNLQRREIAEQRACLFPE